MLPLLVPVDRPYRIQQQREMPAAFSEQRGSLVSGAALEVLNQAVEFPSVEDRELRQLQGIEEGVEPLCLDFVVVATHAGVSPHTLRDVRKSQQALVAAV